MHGLQFFDLRSNRTSFDEALVGLVAQMVEAMAIRRQAILVRIVALSAGVGPRTFTVHFLEMLL
jgi:hypothetical protein